MVSAQMGRNDSLVATKESAYMLMPPEVVSGGLVQSAKWSTDGRYVLVQRMLLAKPEVLLNAIAGQTPPRSSDLGKQEIGLFNVKSHRYSSLLTLPMETQVLDLGIIAGTPMVVAVLATSQEGHSNWEVVALDGATNKNSSLFKGADTSAVPLYFSPTSPVAIVELPTEAGMSLRAIGANGQVSNSIELPKSDASLVQFDEAGVAYLLRIGPEKPGAKRDRSWSRLNFALGQMTEVPSFRPYVPSEENGELTLYYQTTPVSVGPGKGTAHVVYLAPKEPEKDSPMPSVAVTLEGRDGSISPTGDSVLYISQECAFIRHLLKVPRQMMLDSILAAQKAVAVSNSKQAALAVLMYASDHNDRYPDAEQFRDGAMPYLKNADILNSFVYTYAGGPITDIASPADTEIGYVPGPGGRAVAYADGHVRWIKD